MKGPKPVCTSARKKMKQSRPRWLCADGGGLATGTGSGTTFPSPACLRRSPSSAAINWNGRATNRLLPLVIGFPGLQTAGRAEHDHRSIFLVFGRLAYLLLGQFQRDAVALVGDGAETKRAPVDDDLAAADAEEAAEIDHCGAHHAVAANDNVNNAAHVLVDGAADLAAKDAVGVARPDHGDGGRRRRLLHGILRHRASRGLALCPYAGGHGKRHGQHGNKPSRVHTTLPFVFASRFHQCVSTIDTWIWPRVRNTSSETSSPWRRSRKSTLEGPSLRSRSTTSFKNSGSFGSRRRISPRAASNSRPRAASSKVKAAPLAQAC